MHRTQLFIPKPLLKRLRAEAKEKGISVAEVVRRICEAYYEQKGGRR